MTTVFLSYAREDFLIARKLYDELNTSTGCKIWFDKVSLEPGQRWEPAIRRAIRDARLVLLLVSSTSLGKTGFYQKEIRLALDILDEHPDDDTYLLPVRIDNCDIPIDRIRALQYVDLFPEWDEGVKHLRRALTIHDST